MQSNARVCRETFSLLVKSINCRVARAHIKQFAYKERERGREGEGQNHFGQQFKIVYKRGSRSPGSPHIPPPPHTPLPHMSIKLARPRCGCHGHNSSQRSALNSAAAALLRQAGIGNRGQTNYTMGTAIDDSLRLKICTMPRRKPSEGSRI